MLAVTAWLVADTGSVATSLFAQGPGTSYAPLRPQAASPRGEARETSSPSLSARPAPLEAPSAQTDSTDQIEFEHISVEQGLSQSSVNCILQDSRGFMWFGTNDGLNRYDGHDFVTYHANLDGEPGLSHDTVTSLLEDKSGNL
jgi:hypothetical protein